MYSEEDFKEIALQHMFVHDFAATCATLDDQQAEACRRAVTTKVTVVNASPGTGKTTMICQFLYKLVCTGYGNLDTDSSSSADRIPTILAVTFSRAAASTLKSKMARCIPSHYKLANRVCNMVAEESTEAPWNSPPASKKFDRDSYAKNKMKAAR